MARKKKPAGWKPEPTYMEAWRERAGFSPQQAADEADTTHSTIRRYERGEIAYGAYQLETLARLYGCKRGQLLDTDPASLGDDEARLRSALIAYGVDRDEIPAAMKAIKGFVDDSGARSQTGQPRGLSESASPRREEEPLG